MNKLTDDKIKNIVEILKRHKVNKAGLFGSYSREEAREESDIDILVDMAGTKTLLDLVSLKLDLEDSLGQPVDVVTYNSLNPKIKDKVLKEQRVLL
ncbi:MAG: uncharacterized protein PWR10_1057 [Halanaerobiales bacterium]|nr:uncharacterized protein [Halanaerobiales bacterium]